MTTIVCKEYQFHVSVIQSVAVDAVIESSFSIDATAESGRVGRLVNHSRLHPNLQTKVVTLKDKPRLILVARRDVEEGEELLYDYGDRSKESLKAHPWLAF